MSQKKQNTIITMHKKPNKTTPSERKRNERARRKELGQAAITIHVDERHRLSVRTFEAILNSSDALAMRLTQYLMILNDKLPARKRARLRLPKVNRVDAKAALSNLIDFTLRKRSA